MTIRVYISGNSGNKEIVTHQQRIFMILKSLAIEFEPVDITSPGRENDRDYMREQGKKQEGQRHVLPPQIFNDDDYCGNYDDFDVANEDDLLEEFLKIERKTPKTVPTHSAQKPTETSEPSAEVTETSPIAAEGDEGLTETPETAEEVMETGAEAITDEGESQPVEANPDSEAAPSTEPAVPAEPAAAAADEGPDASEAVHEEMEEAKAVEDEEEEYEYEDEGTDEE